MYEDGERLYRNQLHFDFSDASKKFVVRLQPREDTLYAITEGSGPFQYKWNTGSTDPYILPEGDTTTQYSVIATDSYGQKATATATYFFDATNSGSKPIFASVGAYIKNLNWKIVSENRQKKSIELIYVNNEGAIFYSRLARQNPNSFLDIQETIPITYKGSCIDVPCPEYYLGGEAIKFKFSSKLVSPVDKKLKLQTVRG